MKCPFCNRKPKDIPEYQEHSKQFEISPYEYVMMDVTTYDALTESFCCNDCYVSMGCPSTDNLYQMYREEFNVVPIFM